MPTKLDALKAVLPALTFKGNSGSQYKGLKADVECFGVQVGQHVNTPLGDAYVLGKFCDELIFWVKGHKGISYWRGENYLGPITKWKEKGKGSAFTPTETMISNEQLIKVFETMVVPSSSSEELKYRLETPSHLQLRDAISKNKLEDAESIVEEAQGDDLSTLLSYKDRAGDNLLNQVLVSNLSRKDKLNLVKMLVGKGVSPYVRNNYQQSAAFLSVYNEQGDDIINALLTPESMDRQAISDVIVAAVHKRNVRLVETICAKANKELLKQAFETLYPPGGYAALHMAVEDENYDIAKILIKAGANPYLKNTKGKTAIDLARGKFFKFMKYDMVALLQSNPIVVPLKKDEALKKEVDVLKASWQAKVKSKKRLTQQEYDAVAALVVSGSFDAARVLGDIHAVNMAPKELSSYSENMAREIYKKLIEQYKDPYAAMQLAILDKKNLQALQHAVRVVLKDPAQEGTKRWINQLAQSKKDISLSIEAQKCEFEIFNLKIDGRAELTDAEFAELNQMAKYNQYATKFLDKVMSLKQLAINKRQQRETLEQSVAPKKEPQEKISTVETKELVSKLFDVMLLTKLSRISALARLNPDELEMFAEMVLAECKKDNLSIQDKYNLISTTLRCLAAHPDGSEALTQRMIAAYQDTWKVKPSAPPLLSEDKEVRLNPERSSNVSKTSLGLFSSKTSLISESLMPALHAVQNGLPMPVYQDVEPKKEPMPKSAVNTAKPEFSSPTSSISILDMAVPKAETTVSLQPVSIWQKLEGLKAPTDELPRLSQKVGLTS